MQTMCVNLFEQLSESHTNFGREFLHGGWCWARASLVYESSMRDRRGQHGNKILTVGRHFILVGAN